MHDQTSAPRRAPRRRRTVTRPDAADPRLRGRAYAIPYGRVWRDTLRLATSWPGWTVVAADPRRGEILAEAVTGIFKRVEEVTVLVRLDPFGLTRVDLVFAPRGLRVLRGPTARRIARFLRALDANLEPRG